MYIKQVIIQGFRSYKDQTIIDPFSPHYNVVVGRNGSGKSNFFWAIRFVLGDTNSTMTKEERQSMLHEGSGPATLSAYVEIHFDNSDNRFPTNNDEVILRRTIGLKKDEYSLDKKTVTKSDVNNLLESAGFSKSNPYYIVPQGRVSKLTNAKDSERLAVLKEVAGTRVYETRRAESLKIMEETDIKRQKIDELLDYIDKRLKELEKEKQELNEFQAKDRERRCLEFTLYQREVDKSTSQIDGIEEERVKLIEGSLNEGEGTVDRHQEKLDDIAKRLRGLEVDRQVRQTERADLLRELNDLHKQRAELQVLIQELETSAANDADVREQLSGELERMEASIKTRTSELEKITEQWNREMEQEDAMERELQTIEVQLQQMLTKVSRSKQFSNQGERDKYLKKEIAEVEETLTMQKSQQKNLEQEHKQLQDNLTKTTKDLETHRTRNASHGGDMKDLDRQIAQVKIRRDKLTEERKEMWRNEAKAETSVKSLQNDFNKSQDGLYRTMDPLTRHGLASVKKIAQQNKISGVYGPLYELFTVDDMFRVAVETVAGNSLYHVVVDTDETASKLIEIMNKEKSGRVTFIPLNRLKSRADENQAPQKSSKDSIPMISKLKFDDRYKLAFDQVFGRAVICRTLEIASAYAKTEGVTAVTLEGDRAGRRGELTGGYVDTRKSRLEAIVSMKAQRQKLETEMTNHKTYKADSERIGQEISKLSGELTQLETRKHQLSSSRDPVLKEVTNLQAQQGRLSARITEMEQSIRELVSSIRKSELQLNGLKEELKTPMSKSLTKEDEKTMDRLSKEKEQLQDKLFKHQASRTDAETRKKLAEIELQTNLLPRRDKLMSELQRLGTTSTKKPTKKKSKGRKVESDDEEESVDLASRRAQLQHIENSIEDKTGRIQQIDKDVEKMDSSILELQTEGEKERNAESEDRRSMERIQEALKKLMNRKSTAAQRRELCLRKIRDLGVLPEEAYQKYQRDSSTTLTNKLDKVRESLKKYEHVNKKALDQFNSFTTQRDQLMGRKQELDEAAEAIRDLIRVLDQRKEEAIERTFNQVRKYFGEIFEKLEPKGRGQLIMMRRTDPNQELDEEDDGVDNYTGVGIKVSFNSKVDEGLRNEQLSGGQKSLVALALIFAIQRCDPAPFYLFDEIDANLDPQYRTAVASMIKELSLNAQFITTTFRPEQLQFANRFYGVTFQNKVSNIQRISKEEATAFIEHTNVVQ